MSVIVGVALKSMALKSQIRLLQVVLYLLGSSLGALTYCFFRLSNQLFVGLIHFPPFSTIFCYMNQVPANICDLLVSLHEKLTILRILEGQITRLLPSALFFWNGHGLLMFLS